MVKEEWRSIGERQFLDKLKAMTIPLRRWHRENFGDMDRRIDRFEEEIRKVDEMVSNGVHDGTAEARRKALVSSCKKWYIRMKIHWKQMSRFRHAEKMDRNTRYFHNIASARRRNNRIDALRIHGRLVRNQPRIKVAIREFYKDLYHQETSPNIGFRDGLVRRISEDEAARLELMPTTEEIKNAVWDCESTKAPRCDGYNMNFIKKCLDKMGKEFIEAVSWGSFVLINGSPSKPFKMERGLRQGDPLLPFLFVLVVDVLYRMIGEAITNGRISPLLLLGYKEASLPVRYIGISLGANPRLVKTWKPVIDKVEEKLSLWKAKTLNKVGKLVLIKSVLNSLPIYYLSLYKMTKAVAEKLISLQRQFLWSKEDGKIGMPLVRWEIVMAPRKAGGLGVGDAVVRNTALLFKWWWRFSKEDCPLWKRVVYSWNSMNPFVMLCGQPIPTRGGPWRDICQLQIREPQIREKIIRGLSMDVGNGRTIKFWEDVWLPGGRLKEMFPRLFSVMQEAALPEKITSYSFTSAIWRGFALPRVELFSWFVLVERVNTKERLYKLGVIDQHDNLCVLCCKSVESAAHLFIGCEITWQVWCAWLFALGRIWTMPGTLKQHFESWTNASSRKNERRRWLIRFFAVIWAIWLERNGRVFNNKGLGVMEIINRSFMLSDEWHGGEPLGC
ncbi:uncharacterized protein [Arachis hypogaea]|uniref:uncharacterized protein n=1 Tax=Arachis hypogaea TaxID=3818 RepID=UPI003B2187BB